MTKTREKRPLRPVGDHGPCRDVTLVHISDLHFTSETDPNDAVWVALRQDVAAQKPDVIVATGDLADNAFSEWSSPGRCKRGFEAVRNYLVDLCKACNIDPNDRLMVIPGNHDYRIQGNVVSSRLETLFRSIFKSEFEHRLYPGLHLLVLAYDSNTSDSAFDLATGAVPVEDLLDVADLRTELEKSNKEHAAAWSSAVKVALLHHHPMPIAATEGIKSLTETESFLLLRNSGRFMTQMVNEGVDVVLHGHRHYPSFSRATYDAGHGEHTVAVVSGGSVNHHELHDRSYNVLAITASGEITVARRSLQANKYRPDRKWVVRDYREARELLYARLIADTEDRLHGRRYSRHDVIQPDSGDDVIAERYEEVTSLSGKPVGEMNFKTSSHSGFFGRVKYEAEGTQKISFEIDPEVGADGSRFAAAKFNPPIADTPITYRRASVFTNAIHFSRRDRLNATAQETGEESLQISTIHAYDGMDVSVTFPAEYFPERFRIVVLKPDGETPDYREQQFVEPHLTVIRDVHTATFSLERPLPGYDYQILWELPQDLDPKIAAKDAGSAADITDRLGTAGDARVAQLVADLAKGIDPSVTADLFIYDRGLGGQRLAASTDPKAASVLTNAIRSGVGPVGRAYRRRAVIVTAPVSHSGQVAVTDLADDLKPFSPATKSLIAVPLYYPLFSGRRVGTVVLRTERNASPLHGFCDDLVSRFAVHDHVQSWYLAAIAELAQVDVDMRTLPDVEVGNVAVFTTETLITEIAISCRVAQHKPLSGSIPSIAQRLSK